MSKKIIIIGGGIAGLSAGCYVRMNGYDTEIFEMHNLPGGVCTSWKRKGYTFDGCVHWLVGSSPNNPLYYIWKELGVVQEREFIYHEEFMRIEGREGQVLNVYTNIDRLEEEFKRFAPEDKKVIEKYCNGVRKFFKFNPPMDKAPELINLKDKLKMISSMRSLLFTFLKSLKITNRQFFSRLTNPFLKEAFPLIFPIPEMPMFGSFMNLAFLHKREAGYPIGGSLVLARTIEKRYLNLKGKIHYNSKVCEILVKNEKAVGICLEDGTKHYADTIISAADGHSTIFNMLKGKYLNKKIQKMYHKWSLWTPLIMVFIGVAQDFSKEPYRVYFPLDKELIIAGKKIKYFSFFNYSFDPTIAPKGKSVLSTWIETDYEYWEKLYKDKKLYQKEKKQMADNIVNIIDKRYPGLKKRVEVVDVATPITTERFTGNWKGAYEGWALSKKNFMKKVNKTLPGLKNFYMVGQWVEPGGGIPIVAASGRNIIQIICSKEKKNFITTKP